jgi:signal transduction histidine kinase
MRFPRSLRWQLTLSFTGVAALVTFGVAVGIAVLTEHAVWAPLDAALQEEADTLAGLRSLDRGEDFDAAVIRIGTETDFGPGKFIRVTAMDGGSLAASGTVPPAIAALAPPRMPETRRTTVGREKGAYRVIWYPMPGGGWVEIGVRVRGHVRTLQRARLAIAGTAVLLLVTLALLAWAITTRGTAELARLAAELETVEAGSLDRRLAPRRPTEVDRLVVVLNRLLARLEAAVGHLRRFTADAAHELRTPIAAVRAHLEVALARGRSPEGYRAGLLDALEQTERLGRLAADLLTLSVVEAGVSRGGACDDVVQLDALAYEVAEFIEPVAQEQGRQFGCRIEPAVVRGAPDLLKRLVLNLVDNAFRHTPPTAAVALVVRSVDGTATVQVNDTGPGVPEADLPGVFERFRRGESATAGTGLGLALCREITSRHGGNIVLESAAGAGTSVTVTLPLLREHSP